jgi:hypothetical protein
MENRLIVNNKLMAYYIQMNKKGKELELVKQFCRNEAVGL